MAHHAITLSPFVLNSAYLTAAWDDNLKVEAQGYNGSALNGDKILLSERDQPDLIVPNYVGITGAIILRRRPPPRQRAGSEFVIDNISAYVTPIPPAPPPASMAVLYSFSAISTAAVRASPLLWEPNAFLWHNRVYGTNGDGNSNESPPTAR